MKKIKIITLLSAAFLLTACGAEERRVANTDDDQTIYKQSGNTMNQDDRHDLYNESNNNSNRYGFVREVKSPVPGESADITAQDGPQREQLARSISKMTVALPDVLDSSVVVTDEEVLVSYKTNGGDQNNRKEIADQVKKTALSVVPRWYNVYISDNPAHRQYVENIASMGPYNQSNHKAIRDTVEMMKKDSPQGQQDKSEKMIDQQME